MALAETRLTVLGLNPNDVAAFIVVLILSLPVLLRRSKRWAWLVWPLETALIACLVGTGSRGGALALICGFVVSMILSQRVKAWPKNWKAWMIICVVALLGMVGGLIAFPKGFRLGTFDVSPEASAGRRLEVWSSIPSMLAAAPSGWGEGKAAEAYEQWFEPVGEGVGLRHLLSSHLTWLVEHGWPWRWVYIFLWIAAVSLLIPNRKFPFPIWGVAVWTAFCVALFYNAAGKWWNWPIPVLWLSAAVISRCKQKTLPPWQFWVISVLVSGVFVELPFLSFTFSSSAPLVRALDGGNIILLGTGKPTVAILGPSKEVLGNFYGQEIRRQVFGTGQNSDSIIVVSEPDSTAGHYLYNCRLYVISGGNEMTLYKWKLVFTPKFESKLLLINCRTQPDDWVKVFSRVIYCHGEFFGDPHYADWQDLVSSNPAVSIKTIPGAEAYVSGWWSLLDKAEGK